MKRRNFILWILSCIPLPFLKKTYGEVETPQKKVIVEKHQTWQRTEQIWTNDCCRVEYVIDDVFFVNQGMGPELYHQRLRSLSAANNARWDSYWYRDPRAARVYFVFEKIT